MALTTSQLNTLRQIFGSMERTDFAVVARMYKNAQTAVTQQESLSFRVGQNVYFTDRIGRKIYGSIQKINLKTVKVETQEGTWKVSPSFLSVA